MSNTELIDSHVSVKQCKLAVVALHDHETKKEEKRQESELIAGKEQNVWLIVNVKKIQGTHRFKPTKIPIAYPLVDPRTTPVCLITKDPQREYKDLLEANGVKFISRVVGLLKLQGKFKPYEARRMLLKENGMFLADERVIPKLPKLLGSKWFEAKKQPIPVCLTRKNIKEELERAISSTYMNQNQGTCTSIKIGILSQTPTQILANIQKGLPVIIKNIKGGWDNIQSLQIKTNSSVSLPIWTCALDESEGGRWHGLTAVVDSEEEGSESGDDSEMVVDVVEKKEEKKGKGKGKRMATEDQDDEEETAKPKKKVKGAEGKTSPVSAAKPSTTPTKKASAPTDTPASEKSAVTVTPVDKKARKARKPKTAPASEPVEVEVEVVAEPTPEPAAAAKSKKTKKSRASDVAAAVAPVAVVESEVAPPVAEPEVTVTTPVKAKKEKRKAKAKANTSEGSVEAPATTETPVVESAAVVEATELPKKKLNKKAKSRLAAATESVEVPATPAAVPSAVIEVPVEVLETEKKTKRKGKKGKSEVAAVETETLVVVDVETKAEAPTLTTEELKQKKSGGAGEKKKEKVVKSKGKGKSAKDAIIGKKVAQG